MHNKLVFAGRVSKSICLQSKISTLIIVFREGRKEVKWFWSIFSLYFISAYFLGEPNLIVQKCCYTRNICLEPRYIQKSDGVRINVRFAAIRVAVVCTAFASAAEQRFGVLVHVQNGIVNAIADAAPQINGETEQDDETWGKEGANRHNAMEWLVSKYVEFDNLFIVCSNLLQSTYFLGICKLIGQQDMGNGNIESNGGKELDCFR